jgi:hypothetical protein
MTGGAQISKIPVQRDTKYVVVARTGRFAYFHCQKNGIGLHRKKQEAQSQAQLWATRLAAAGDALC